MSRCRRPCDNRFIPGISTLENIAAENSASVARGQMVDGLEHRGKMARSPILGASTLMARGIKNGGRETRSLQEGYTMDMARTPRS